MTTTIRRDIALAAVATVLQLAACDAGEQDAELDDWAEEDLDPRGWGCAYYASSPPAVDNTYFPEGGKSKGGCDLHVTAHSLPQAESRVSVWVTAFADAPLAEVKGRVWGQYCAGNYCGPWSIENFDWHWQDPEFGIGYCDEAETVPCKYRVSGGAIFPYDKSFNRFRVGTSAIDENGTSIYVEVRDVH